jgi:hypothetical protein
MSGQLHAPAALSGGKYPRYPRDDLDVMEKRKKKKFWEELIAYFP